MDTWITLTLISFLLQLFSGECLRMKRGVFILFEGVDRCGKTTQSAMLTKALCDSNRPSELIRFPERSTTIGNLIDLYLKSASNLNDQSIHLLFSANRWERSSFIEESLQQGKTLVSTFYARGRWEKGFTLTCVISGVRSIRLQRCRVHVCERAGHRVVQEPRPRIACSRLHHLP